MMREKSLHIWSDLDLTFAGLMLSILGKRPRRESNPHLRFRKPPFYPLNYGDDDICDFRFAISDCK
jgi:hypothetical protein